MVASGGGGGMCPCCPPLGPALDKFIKESWLTVAEGRRSLCYLNVEGCDGYFP